MSTSASPSSSTSISPGKCVVCGKETWMRCSACSEAGLDWMCFCSIGHQKMIWFLHKRVCGERSNPFRFPGFTTKEVDEMIHLSEQPINATFTSRPVSWLEMYGDVKKLPKAIEIRRRHFKERLESLMESRISNCVTPQIESSIVEFRSNAYRFRLNANQYLIASGMDKDLIESAAARNLFDVFVWAQHQETHGQLSPFERDRPEWLSALQHKRLVRGALMIRRASGKEYTDLQECETFVNRDLERFVHDRVESTHPQVAQSLLKRLAGISFEIKDESSTSW